MENHHAINGNTHYFYGHFQVRKLLVSQAGYVHKIYLLVVNKWQIGPAVKQNASWNLGLS